MMGYGSYKASDWADLKKSRKLSESSPVKSVFKTNSVSSFCSVYRISPRESRDSLTSPIAVPVIIGFDVTSSMGYLAKELAVSQMNQTISSLYEGNIIKYPHVMCTAVGDCKSDRYPLQATQFEADIRIIKQLTQLYLEGGGGGNDGESYNLLWYFASRLTSTDHYEKRREKGFLITIGDDKCHRSLTRQEIRAVFGQETEYDISNEELVREAEKKYELFHINIEKDDDHDYQVLADWQRYLPGRITVIRKKDIACLSQLIISLILTGMGASPKEALAGLPQQAAKCLSRSLAMIKTEKADKLVF